MTEKELKKLNKNLESLNKAILETSKSLSEFVQVLSDNKDKDVLNSVKTIDKTPMFDNRYKKITTSEECVKYMEMLDMSKKYDRRIYNIAEPSEYCNMAIYTKLVPSGNGGEMVNKLKKAFKCDLIHREYDLAHKESHEYIYDVTEKFAREHNMEILYDEENN